MWDLDPLKPICRKLDMVLSNIITIFAIILRLHNKTDCDNDLKNVRRRARLGSGVIEMDVRG